MIYVILLQWRDCADTLECLASLEAAGHADLRVLVVDNGTPPACRATLRARFPAVELLENERNLGFAAGNNRGIAHALAAGAEYILILNNDTVVTPGFLTPLLAALAGDRRIGIVGPKIMQYDAPERIWFAGTQTIWLFGRPLRVRHRGFGRLDRGRYDRPQAGDFLSGCAMLLRREVFERVGLFDADYFAYFEDMDLCVRTRRAGYRILYLPESQIYHKAANSSTGRANFSPLSVYLTTRNTLLFMRRQGAAAGWLIFVPLFGLRLLWRFARYRAQRLPRAGEAMLLGILDFALNRLGAGSMARFRPSEPLNPENRA